MMLLSEAKKINNFMLFIYMNFNVLRLNSWGNKKSVARLADDFNSRLNMDNTQNIEQDFSII